MGDTNIQWTDKSWNVLTSGPGFGVTLHPEALAEPLRWRKPRRVFVDSMSDLFHEQVPDEFIFHVWSTMALAQEHIFQVLTKRPERMLQVLDRLQNLPGGHKLYAKDFWPLPNVWLGVSIESQRWTSRLDTLARVPATVRFLSAEPLLGPLDLKPWLEQRWGGFTGAEIDRLPAEAAGTLCAQESARGLDWVIIGGESGPGARPCSIGWIRDIVRQCRDAGVPCFVKQLGLYPYRDDGSDGINAGNVLILKDRKGSDPNEWPEDLQVREWPPEQRRN